jgi:predicted extracellular nuclease
LFPARSGRNQLCGLAWDSDAVTVRSEMIAATAAEPIPGEENIWSRPPPVLLFSAGEGLTDFAVVMLHMKSNYNGDFSAQRGREAHHLVADLPHTTPDRDIIIMGDTNCNKPTEPAIRIICKAGFMDLTPKDARTFWRGNAALDRIFVPADQPEFASRKFEILRDDYLSRRSLSLEDFKRRYSDHFMVVTELTVMDDDD